MAEGVWIHNGKYDEEELLSGESKAEDIAECLSFPLTRKDFMDNINKIINHISDLESQIEKNEDAVEERDEMEQKLDEILDTIQRTKSNW